MKKRVAILILQTIMLQISYVEKNRYYNEGENSIVLQVNG